MPAFGEAPTPQVELECTYVDASGPLTDIRFRVAGATTSWFAVRVATARLNEQSIPLTQYPTVQQTASWSMGRATKTRLTFKSVGEPLVGNLYLPDGDEPAGMVVAVGPLTSVKEQAAGTYARALAERGYAALAFDYRYFGESGGRPRQFENPDANIDDIKNAATALLAEDRLTNLPLFGLGIC